MSIVFPIGKGGPISAGGGRDAFLLSSCWEGCGQLGTRQPHQVHLGLGHWMLGRRKVR